MKAELKSLIIENYKIAFNKINEIISGKSPNWFIKSEKDYLSPSIMTLGMSLDDNRGEFFYYNTICEKLENLLAGEKTRHVCYFNGAPREIQELFEPVAA